MKKILVPTDFSKESKNAVEAAVKIAKKSKGTIELLHTEEAIHSDSFSFSGAGPGGDPMEKVFMVKLLKKIKTKLHQIMNQNKSVKINDHVEFGRPHDAILDYVKNKKVDLVVMGSKGMAKNKNLFVGSNTEKVVRAAAAPVLILHDKEVPSSFKKIVYATQGKVHAPESIDFLKKFQKLFSAKVHMLSIITPNDFASSFEVKGQLERMVSAHKIPNTVLSAEVDYNTEEGVVRYAKSIDADLIIMETHSRSFLGSLLGQSISMDVAKSTKIPVLLFGV